VGYWNLVYSERKPRKLWLVQGVSLFERSETTWWRGIGGMRRNHNLVDFSDFFKYLPSSIAFLLLLHGVALTSSDGDNICALASSQYAGGSHCGKWVTIRNADTGAQTAVCQFSLSPLLPSLTLPTILLQLVRLTRTARSARSC